MLIKFPYNCISSQKMSKRMNTSYCGRKIRIYRISKYIYFSDGGKNSEGNFFG